MLTLLARRDVSLVDKESLCRECHAQAQAHAGLVAPSDSTVPAASYALDLLLAVSMQLVHGTRRGLQLDLCA